MAPVSRLAERRWRKLRSEHARTLQGLESAMRVHPAGSARSQSRPALRNVAILRDGDDDGSNAA